MHKDNITKFQSNRYTVPLGTYKPYGENVVSIEVKGDQLMILPPSGGDPIAIHPLAKGKGHLIKNTHHSRDRSHHKIKDYMEVVRNAFEDEEKINMYLSQLQHYYPRYIREQLQVLQRSIEAYP